MDMTCIIKVSDLLRNPIRSDEIVIEDCMIHSISHLCPPGIVALCRLRATSDGTILVSLTDIRARMNDVCDLSGEEYIRDIHIPLYESRFSVDVVYHEDPDYVYEDDFPFLPDGESIDIKDMLIQAIILQEPLVHIKPGNEILIGDDVELSDDSMT